MAHGPIVPRPYCRSVVLNLAMFEAGALACRGLVGNASFVTSSPAEKADLTQIWMCVAQFTAKVISELGAALPHSHGILTRGAREAEEGGRVTGLICETGSW